MDASRAVPSLDCRDERHRGGLRGLPISCLASPITGWQPTFYREGAIPSIACCDPILTRVGAAEKRVAVHQDRLPGAEVEGVHVRRDLDPETLELHRPLPEPFLQQDRA